MTIKHLYVSSEHNYFGHHGQPAGTAPVVEVEEIHCVAGRGIEGDRFFDYKPDYKGQITFFSWEVYEQLCEQLQVNHIGPEVFRRNVIVEGVNLNDLVGEIFEIQGVQFQGIEECRPCYWMDEAVSLGAELAMKGKGGLRAQILSSGMLRKGKA